MVALKWFILSRFVAPSVSLTLKHHYCSNQTLRGVMAGCGLQMLNAKISISATWLWGLPLAYTLAFVLERGLLGVWEGQTLSTLMRQGLLFFFAMRINWAEMSAKARECTTSRLCLLLPASSKPQKSWSGAQKRGRRRSAARRRSGSGSRARTRRRRMRSDV